MARRSPTENHFQASGFQQRHKRRQVIVQEVPEVAHEAERVNRLASLLAEALARRLGQVPAVAAESPAASLDYPPKLSPTTGAKSAVPTEEA